jgi:hypothetical protein
MASHTCRPSDASYDATVAETNILGRHLSHAVHQRGFAVSLHIEARRDHIDNSVHSSFRKAAMPAHAMILRRPMSASHSQVGRHKRPFKRNIPQVNATADTTRDTVACNGSVSFPTPSWSRCIEDLHFRQAVPASRKRNKVISKVPHTTSCVSRVPALVNADLFASLRHAHAAPHYKARKRSKEHLAGCC